MAINTTLYVHRETARLIDEMRHLTDERRTSVIILLLKRVMADGRKAGVLGSAIRYQNRDAGGGWQTIHVRFREDEADFFKDLRNFLKQSCSLILAIAAREYLREMIRKPDGRYDNYQFSNYILSREVNEGLVFWKICWGFPLEPRKYFRILL